MVGVRKRAQVNYAENAGPVLDSDDEREQEQEQREAQARRATPSKQRARKRSAAEVAADVEEAPLLDIVKKHGSAIAVAAKEWVDRYRESRGAATAELLSFMLQACGVDYTLTEEAVEEGEVDAVREELDQLAQQDGLVDHWRAGTKAAVRAFRGSYLELWAKLMREAYAADQGLFDQYLLDKLSSLLIALNTSVIREFRSVATLTSAQLVTAWTHISLALGEARDTAERQLAAEERKKGGGKAAADRIAAFRRNVDRCHARIQELRSYSDALFQGIFAHRFRDCADEIRATVIEGIGSWVRLHPSVFLTDQYLKYIAWALSDKDARVRLASVSALLALYSNPDNLASLSDFTQRFQQRFSELFYDADEAVAVKGVELNTLLVKQKQAQPSQFAQVYELLADESHAVRHAVAELVAAMLEEQGAALLAQAPPSSGKKQKGGRKQLKGGEGSSGSTAAERQLAGLLQVMHLLANPPPEEGGEGGQREEEEEARPLEREVVSQVVDALFDRVPVLSDWALLLAWVQQGKAEAHFGEAGVTNLLHLLRDALRKATGGQLPGSAVPPAGRGGAAGRERQQAQAAARQDATLALMKDLPALLRKVQTDPLQAAALVGAIPEMRLEVYALKRQEKGFASLAGVVKDTFLKHADPQVAQECVAALAACARAGPDSIKAAAQLALTECTDDVAAGLASAVGALERAGARRVAAAVAALEASGGEDEAQVLFDVRAALARLRALLSLGGGAAEEEEVYEALAKLLEWSAGGSALPSACVRDAALCALLLLAWRLRQLDREFPDPAALADLAAKRAAFVGSLESIAEGAAAADGSADGLRDELAGALADTFLLFSAAKYAGTALEAVGFEPSDDAVHTFWQLSETTLRHPVQAEEEEDAPSIAARMAPQRAAASRAAQVALFRAVPQHAWLAAHLVSQWVGPEAAVSDGAVWRWAPVADVIKEACRLMRKAAPEDMPPIYLEALKAAHARIEPREEDVEEEEGIAPDQEFLALSDRIAKTYAGFNSSAAALEHIIVEGAKHALRDGPEHLSFLEGVAFFVRALPAARAEAVRAAVEAAAAPHDPAPGDSDWETYHLFLECIDKRAAKGRVKSVLKKGGGSAAGGGSGGGGATRDTARKAPRKISFAPGAGEEEGIEESEEEEEQPREAIESEAEEERPGALRALPRSSGRRSGGRPATSGGSSRRRGRASQPQDEEQSLAAVEEDGEEGAAAEEDEQWQEQQGEEEEEAEEVMPTMEAEALPRAQPQQGRRRGPKLHSMFAAEEEEAAAEEQEQQQESEEEDEDLPAIRGRARGGSQRQPVVVDPQPQLPAAAEESEDEEERPARRRRRR
ncbi:hypothetical protein ABPG75_010465 [Micractinium tetrahymenae]